VPNEARSLALKSMGRIAVLIPLVSKETGFWEVSRNKKAESEVGLIWDQHRRIFF